MFDPGPSIVQPHGHSDITAWLTQPFSLEAVRVLATAESQARLTSRSWSHRHAFLAALDHRGTLDGLERELERDFLGLRCGDFIAKWCGRKPRGVAGVLGRLGASHASSRGAYVALFDIMAEDGDGARTLRHLPSIAFDRVLQFSQVPDWMRTGRLPEPDELPAWVARSAGQIADEALRSGKRTKEQLWSDLPRPYRGFSDWMALAGQPMVFPDPLWPGTERLKHLRDADALRQARERFRNCIMGHLDDCLSGTKAVYIWEGEEPAIASVLQVSGMVIIEQINGVENEQVSYDTQFAIMTEFPDASAASAHAAPF